MDPQPQRQKGRDGLLSALNKAFEDLDSEKEISGVTAAKAAFGSVSTLLRTIRVNFLSANVGRLLPNCIQESVTNGVVFVGLRLTCADLCKTLDRKLIDRRTIHSIIEAIGELTYVRMSGSN